MSEKPKIADDIKEEVGEWNTHAWGTTPWIAVWDSELVQLDGDFTKRELERIAKHMEYEK